MTEVMEKTANELTLAELEQLMAQKKAEENNQVKKAREQYEGLKENIILDLVPAAKALSEQLDRFKVKAFSDMDALYELLCSYSKRHADGKGNFSIEIPEGMKISYKRQDTGFFDERSQQAERHIIDFVNSQYKDDDATKDLITSLLERKKGKLDIRLVQKLYSMENSFDDTNWREGIKLLKESWTASETKSYISFEVKNENKEWISINLNFASI